MYLTAIPFTSLVRNSINAKTSALVTDVLIGKISIESRLPKAL
jgi:hypothetical protein